MEFRRATPEDAESILQFWNDSGASIGATDEVRHVRRVTENPAAVLLLALIDGTIVGSLLCITEAELSDAFAIIDRGLAITDQAVQQ